MNTLTSELTAIVSAAFEKSGYEAAYGLTSYSNRPDLGQFQCNGALAAAKKYAATAPEIAEKVAEQLKGVPAFKAVSVVKPGFINISLSDERLGKYLEAMSASEHFGVEAATQPLTIVLDYGGPNVAKPLHVGHLRSAIIGECIKRVARYLGHKVIGDAHLGDWGLQIGLIITELHERKPELSYFDPKFTAEYPKEPPFDMTELEEIYPHASARSKSDDAYREAARLCTVELQNGRRGYRALWQHIMDLSIADLKKNYARLDVHFDLWEGESDAEPFIAPLVEKLKTGGFAHISEGALVVDVQEAGDKTELPPCIILKSDGGALYETTDLATIMSRVERFNPDRILYIVDKRQELHFKKVFRVAKKAGLISAQTVLDFLGFGTMNGKDGKPFKTREGGVVRLEAMLNMVADAALPRLAAREEERGADALREGAQTVALAAIKYGDLSNQPSKDYIFDMERFTAFEGKTGPYVQYSMVRIKSILNKYAALNKPELPTTLPAPVTDVERLLALKISSFAEAVHSTYEQNSPQRLCLYAYELCDLFNGFYNERNILGEADEAVQRSYIVLLRFILALLEDCIQMLGFTAPDRM